MKVLYITYGLPTPPSSGARLRDFHLLKQLAARHQVTCLVLLQATDKPSNRSALEAHNIRTVTFAPQPTTLFGYTLGLVRHVAAGHPPATFDFWNVPLFECLRQLVQEAFDVVQIEHSFLAPYVDALPHSSQTRTILDLHNL